MVVCTTGSNWKSLRFYLNSLVDLSIDSVMFSSSLLQCFSLPSLFHVSVNLKNRMDVIAIWSVLMLCQILHYFLVFLPDKQMSIQSFGSKGLSS